MHAARRFIASFVAAAAVSCSSGGGGDAPAGGGPGGTWSAPVYYPPPEGQASVVAQVRVAVDSGGDAMMFWANYLSTTQTYHYSRYDAGTGTWGAAVPFAPSAAILPMPQYMPDLGMQGDGEAVLAWYGGAFVGGGPIYVARAAPGADFPADPEVLTSVDTTPTVTSVRLDVRESGHAVLGWTRDDPGGATQPLSAWAAVYDPELGWSAAARVEHTSTDVVSGSLRVAADGTGGAFAVWTDELGQVSASRYVPAGWGAAYVQNTVANGSAQPDVAAAADGRAIFAWMQQADGGARQHVYTSRFAPLTGFGVAERLMSAPTATSHSFAVPSVAMNDGGAALALWREFDGTYFQMWGSGSPAGGGWNAPANLDGRLREGDTALAPALFASGDGMTCWGARDRVHARGFGAAGTWGATVQLSASLATAYAPRMAMNASGRGVVGWVEEVSPGIARVGVRVFSP